MCQEAETPYAPYGLLTALYTSRHLPEGLGRWESDVRGRVADYERALRKPMKHVLAPETGDGAEVEIIDDYFSCLYKPYQLVTFGQFDCAALLLIDDYKLTPELAGLPSTVGEKFETGHIVERRDAGRLLWQQEQIHGALQTAGCIAISRLKLHVMFSSVLGHRIYHYVGDMISAIAGDGNHDNLSVILCEGLGGADLLLVLTAGSFAELGQFIADVRETSFASLWELLPPEKRKDRREQVGSYADSPLGRRIRGDELPDGLPIQNHLFLNTDTTVGYSLGAHKAIESVVAGNVPQETLCRYNLGDIAVHSHARVKPGHLARAQRKLRDIRAERKTKPHAPGPDDVIFYFGDADLISSGHGPEDTDRVLVPAADYVASALHERNELYSSPPLDWKPSDTSDFNAFNAVVGVAVTPRRGTDALSDEVAPFFEWLKCSPAPSAEEAKDQDLLFLLGLPTPYVHGLKALLKTHRMFRCDPFAADWMFEMQDYVVALRQYLRDVLPEGDRAHIAKQLSEAVAIYERAFPHRMRSGDRMTQLTDCGMELKGALVRPLSAIHAILNSILHASRRIAPEPDRIETGALAVLVADPGPKVLPLVSAHSRCIGATLSAVVIQRPECL